MKPIITLLFLALGLNALRAADAPKRPPLDLKGVRILVCAGYWADMTGIPCLLKLSAAGAEVRRIRRPELIWETVQQYHLVIYTFDQARGKTQPGAEGPDEVLQKFIQAGGGVLFIPTGFESKDDINRVLAPYEASLRGEFLQDPRNTFTSTSAFFHLPYAYTENIAAGHPATEGVKGVWYDVSLEGESRTSSIEVSKDWNVLVSGEKSATTIQIVGLTIQGREIGEEQKKPGKYTSAPPILAAREYGAGAIAFMGLNGVEIFYGQGLPHYGDVAMEKGDGLRRSDLGRIYENSLVWLAQHGRKSSDLGKGDLKPQVAAEIQKIDWSQDVLGGQQCARPAKGVVGLHSTPSDGKATPEALIAKAKASGLQWVAFTEKLEILADGKWNPRSINTGLLDSAGERKETNSPDKWEQLRKICKDASTGDFTAVPGLDYADNTGDRWAVCGDFEWPPEKSFSADRKKILDPMFLFAIGLAANGPYNTGKNRLRPWDYSIYNHWAIRTTLKGKLSDNSSEAFRYLQGIQDDPFPRAVDMVYDEKELEAASRRMCNYLTVDQPGDLTKLFRDTHYFGSWRGFVSNGPVVTDWRCANACRTTGSKWHVPSTERYRVKLSVESEAATATTVWN